MLTIKTFCSFHTAAKLNAHYSADMKTKEQMPNAYETRFCISTYEI